MTDIFEQAHEIIGNMDEWERGAYWGFIQALFYAQAQASKGALTIEFDPEDLLSYMSPSGTIRDPEHPFYGVRPALPEDTITHHFDLRKLYAVYCEVDREAHLYYLSARLVTTQFGRYINLEIHCTEDFEHDPWFDTEIGEATPWCDLATADRVMKEYEEGGSK